MDFVLKPKKRYLVLVSCESFMNYVKCMLCINWPSAGSFRTITVFPRNLTFTEGYVFQRRGGTGLPFNGDFFDKADDDFERIGEKVIKRLNFIDVGQFVNVKLQAGAAGIVIETAVYVVPGIFPTARRSSRIYRAQAVFQQDTNAAVGFDKRCPFVGHKHCGADSLGFFGCYYGSAYDPAAFGAFVFQTGQADRPRRKFETIQAVASCLDDAFNENPVYV
jgi:hypothetical protein